MNLRTCLSLGMLGLCMSCSPVTLKNSAQDGGNSNPDSGTPGMADASADAGDPCNPDGSEDFCDGARLNACNADGQFEVTICNLDCAEAPTPHCRELRSALFGEPISSICGQAQNFAFAESLLFDSTSGEIREINSMQTVRQPGTGMDAQTGIGFEIRQQGSAPEVGVFSFGSLSIPTGTHELRGTRAVAFVACDEMKIDGVLEATGRQALPGPGGFPSNPDNPDVGGPGVGGAGEPLAINDDQSGGGGGGYGGAGGPGGNGLNQGGNAGIIYGNQNLQSLIGGSAGGASGSGIPGGGGGGAIYLASGVRIAISGQGGINVGGGGGSASSLLFQGAGGGGAGGSILLDAPEIELTGGATLAANGGGGGATSSNPTEPGQDGLLATGAAGPNRGGAVDTVNGEPGNPSGGGGGGCGRIHLLTEGGQFTNVESILTPSVDANNSVGETLVSEGQALVQ